jgi:two-component system response regulator FixJ
MTPGAPVIVIDDNLSVRTSLRALLESLDLRVKDYSNAVAFLSDDAAECGACLIVDIRMPGMTGLELQEELGRRNAKIPMIVMTGYADVGLAVKAMKAGAVDFLEKPFDGKELLASVRRAIELGLQTRVDVEGSKIAAAKIALLTVREREVLNLLVVGESNKLVAHNLSISPRTVAIHRAHLQEKLGAHSLADLVRIMRTAGQLY